MVCLCGSLSWQLLLPAAVLQPSEFLVFIEVVLKPQQVAGCLCFQMLDFGENGLPLVSGCQLDCLGVLACPSQIFFLNGLSQHLSTHMH